ncbi:acetyl-CoA carboxylase biotin carboxyl carrier protein subunit [Niallia oryzisoli]|uniref:Acetyl-CoA carboxylase biotin carboxyl carrier protein subunit n=1 Tax=Niallia oryzisoli TaxID=1737571 RepID=A0ABZ2CIZ8_9BACI
MSITYQRKRPQNEEEIKMTTIAASMAGNVWKVLVSEGEKVEEGQDVVILESMKMEIPISAEQDGVVKKIHIQEGDFVNDADGLVDIE